MARAQRTGPGTSWPVRLGAAAPCWLVILALTAAGCTAAVGVPGASSAPREHRARARPDAAVMLRGTGARRGGYPAAFVASVDAPARPAGGGLAVFSSATGRLIRWLVHSARGPVPVAVSPGGRWVYYVDQADIARGVCAGNGFTEPSLWRVSAGGGRPGKTAFHTTSIAFSPDEQMVAWTWTRRCGRTAWITVRDRPAGVTRRILLARNAPASNNPVFSAHLAWAPDDTHLAVAVAPAAAINAVFVIDARRAVRLPGRAIRPCSAPASECADPAYDTRGALTFLRWLNQVRPAPQQVVRWQDRRATVLFRLSRDQSAGFSATIATDASGTAVLVQGGLRRAEIWRWSAGPADLILRSTPQRIITSPQWEPARRQPQH